MGRETGGTKAKPMQVSKKHLPTSSNDMDKHKIAKKRSLDEDEFKSSAATTTTTTPTPTATINTIATAVISSKRPRVDNAEPVPPIKPDAFANPFLPEDDSDSEDEAEEDKEFDDDEYDAESDEEADSLRSQILEDFVLTQSASGDGSTLLDAIAGASGDGDDTISMDSDEIEAINKAATGSSFGPYRHLLGGGDADGAGDARDMENVDDAGGTVGADARRPLRGVRIVFSGYPPELEKDLSRKARELGAEYPSLFLSRLLDSHLLVFLFFFSSLLVYIDIK